MEFNLHLDVSTLLICLVARLLLLLAEERPQRHTGHLHDLRTPAEEVTAGNSSSGWITHSFARVAYHSLALSQQCWQTAVVHKPAEQTTSGPNVRREVILRSAP